MSKPNFKSSMNFSTKIHDTLAVDLIYKPLGFINISSEVGTTLDMRKGIDYTAQIPESIGSEQFVNISIQERFRNYDYAHYRDVTFRYDRPEKKSKSEYSFIEADFFLYGIANKNENDFEWAYMFEVAPVINALSSHSIQYDIRSNSSSGDTRFITISIDEIDKLGATIFKYHLT